MLKHWNMTTEEEITDMAICFHRSGVEFTKVPHLADHSPLLHFQSGHDGAGCCGLPHSGMDAVPFGTGRSTDPLFASLLVSVSAMFFHICESTPAPLTKTCTSLGLSY